ncbi:hypothetical protein HDU81_011325 [Chytriomyces hyalinus]|nr:hypothetical protein HDU81_011324 [Chytriomyces hyalinus]KAJ3235954.1 hypothetical protein HDU81_011325 [Chytriomyces hyalinus]
MYRIFLTLLWSTPFTSLLPPVAKLGTLSLPVAESEQYYNIAHFASGGVVTVMDAFFAWAFYSHLMKYAHPTSSNNAPCVNTNGARLKIIAQYDLISSCFCFLAITGYVTLTIVFFLDASLASPSAWRVYLLGYITVDFGSTAALVTPVIMKLRLHQVWIEGIRSHEEDVKTLSFPNADSDGFLTMQKSALSLKRIDTSPSLVVSEK